MSESGKVIHVDFGERRERTEKVRPDRPETTTRANLRNDDTQIGGPDFEVENPTTILDPEEVSALQMDTATTAETAAAEPGEQTLHGPADKRLLELTPVPRPPAEVASPEAQRTVQGLLSEVWQKVKKALTREVPLAKKRSEMLKSCPTLFQLLQAFESGRELPDWVTAFGSNYFMVRGFSSVMKSEFARLAADLGPGVVGEGAPLNYNIFTDKVVMFDFARPLQVADRRYSEAKLVLCFNTNGTFENFYLQLVPENFTEMDSMDF